MTFLLANFSNGGAAGGDGVPWPRPSARMERGARSLPYISIRWPSRPQRGRREKDRATPYLFSLYAAITRAFRRGAHSAATRHMQPLRKAWQNRSRRVASGLRQAQSQSRQFRSRDPNAIRALQSWLATDPRSPTIGNGQAHPRTTQQTALPVSYPSVVA